MADLRPDHKVVRYACFRYQILPRNRASNDLFDPDITIDELISKKNEYFRKVITERGSSFFLPGRKIQKVLEAQEQDCYRFKMNLRRGITLETRDFKKERKESYPKFTVVVFNDPSEQYLLIEERAALGTKSEILANALIADINQQLSIHNLVAECQPLFSAIEFWKLVTEHSGNVARARFELITPNMSNISSTLAEEFKELAKGANATKTVIELAAEKEMSLDLSNSNNYQRGLVEYAAEGGGNISLTIRGRKAKIATQPKHKTIEILEQVFLLKGMKEFAKRLRRAINA